MNQEALSSSLFELVCYLLDILLITGRVCSSFQYCLIRREYFIRFISQQNDSKNSKNVYYRTMYHHWNETNDTVSYECVIWSIYKRRFTIRYSYPSEGRESLCKLKKAEYHHIDYRKNDMGECVCVCVCVLSGEMVLIGHGLVDRIMNHDAILRNIHRFYQNITIS